MCSRSLPLISPTKVQAEPRPLSIFGPKPPKGHFVYFVGALSGPVKIGFTQQAIEVRLRGIQNGSPVKLHVLALRPGTKFCEGFYHREFSDHRLHGEWFERCPAIENEIERLRRCHQSLHRKYPDWLPASEDCHPRPIEKEPTAMTSPKDREPTEAMWSRVRGALNAVFDEYPVAGFAAGSDIRDDLTDAALRAMVTASPPVDHGRVERVAKAGHALLCLAANGRPGMIAKQVAEWEAALAALTNKDTAA